MNNRNRLNEYFSFILVDDNSSKIEINSLILNHYGIDYSVITKGDYHSRLMLAVKNIHLEGKFPVIFLDENFEPSERLDGTHIAISLINGFNQRGGIILPFSSDPNEQVDNWSKEIKDTGSWFVVREGKLPIEYFREGDIDEICNMFVEGLEKEEDEEIKRG